MSDQHWANGPHSNCTPREEGASVPTHVGVITRAASMHHQFEHHQPEHPQLMHSQRTQHDTTGGAGLWSLWETTGADADLPCRQNPADLWFAEAPEDVEAAKALCSDCPIRAQCLAQALERSEPWGVWGGQLVIQGVVVPRKRPRGRPRKNTVAA